MTMREIVTNLYIFLVKLKMKIKNLTEEQFQRLLSDEKLDYTQRLYLIYFRYL